MTSGPVLSMAQGEASGAVALLVVFLIIVFYALVFALSIGGFVLWIWMLIDAATRPEWQYPDARPGGNTKVVWILVVAIGGLIGAVVYYFMVRRKMGKAGSSAPPPPWWYWPPSPWQGYPPAPSSQLYGSHQQPPPSNYRTASESPAPGSTTD